MLPRLLHSFRRPGLAMPALLVAAAALSDGQQPFALRTLLSPGAFSEPYHDRDEDKAEDEDDDEDLIVRATSLPSSASPVAVVGGHSGIVSHDGKVYKPLPAGPRGDMEAGFYLQVNKGARRFHPPATFMPPFHGLVVVEDESEESGAGKSKSPKPPKRYLALDDLTSSSRYRRPCVMDIKVGVQAWDEDASVPKIHKEASKYPTQQTVGFRLTGMRVWDKRPAFTRTKKELLQAGDGDEHRVARLKNAGQDEGNGHFPAYSASHARLLGGDSKEDEYHYNYHPQGAYREHGRAFGYSLDAKTLEEGFREFLFDGERVRIELIPSFLQRLLDLRKWMLRQDSFRFYGSSLLFIYEGEDQDQDQDQGQASAPSSSRLPLPVGVEVKMIDFAHVWPITHNNSTSTTSSTASSTTRTSPTTSEERDTGYLLGLDSIIRFFLAVMERGARKQHHQQQGGRGSLGGGDGEIEIDYRSLCEWYRLAWEQQDADAVREGKKALLMTKGHHFHHQTQEQDDAALSYATEEAKAEVEEARIRMKMRTEAAAAAAAAQVQGREKGKGKEGVETREGGTEDNSEENATETEAGFT